MKQERNNTMPHRPRDTNQRAKRVVDIAGRVSDEPREATGRAKSGKARAAKLSAERRREIARLGAAARWGATPQ